jgi:hypothetical protein
MKAPKVETAVETKDSNEIPKSRTAVQMNNSRKTNIKNDNIM